MQPAQAIDISNARKLHAIGVAGIWLVPAIMFFVFMRLAEIPQQYQEHIQASWVMVVYAFAGISLAVAILDQRLKKVLQGLNAKIVADGEVRGRQDWVLRFGVFSVVVLLTYLVGGLLTLYMDNPGRLADSPVQVEVLLLGTLAVFLLAVYVAIPHFLYCFNLFGRLLGPVFAQPMALPAAVRTILSGPGVVAICGIALLGFVWFMQFELNMSAQFAGVGLMLYAIVISGLAHTGSQRALQPLFDYARAKHNPLEGVPVPELPPQSLDEIGDLTREVGKIVEREYDTIRRLKDSEDRFRMFAEASSDWFFEIDADLKFSYVSDKLEEITGVPAENVIGLPATAMSAVYEETDYNPHREDLLAHRPYRNYRFEVHTADGKQHHLQVSGVPWFDEHGEFLGYRGTGTDITDLVEAQNSLEAKTLELIQTQKMKAVGQLTGGLAHDFNNLLTVVMGNLELARYGLDEGDQTTRPQIDAAYEAAQRGSNLVSQLMSFSRKQALRAEAVGVVELIEGMRPLLERTLGEHIQIDVQAEDRSALVWADPVQLQNAILNLAINARDAMPSGGTLTVRVSTTEQVPSAELLTGTYALIEVSDTGVGIDLEKIDMVFEPFFTTKEPGEGTGLGLSMVYGFVKQSNGDVKIESVPEAGTKVSIWLPSSQYASVVEPAAQGVSPIVSPAPGQGERVLVVEDDEGVRELLLRQLAQLGFNVIAEASSLTALQRLRDGERFDLLLSDIVLADAVDGIEMVSQAQQLDPELRVVFMTGYTDKHEQIGERILLRKPFSLQSLSECILQGLQHG